MSHSDEQCLDFFQQRWQPAKRNQETEVAKWTAYHQVFLGESAEITQERQNRADWRSRQYPKFAWQQAHTLLPELVQPNASFRIVPREPQDEEAAKLWQRIRDYQRDRDKYSYKRAMATLTAIELGMCPVKVVWDYQTSKRKVRVPGGAPDEFEYKEFVEKDQPTFIVVDPLDFFWDPAAKNHHDWRYVFHRSRLTLAQLKARKLADGSPLYKNLDELEDLVGPEQKAGTVSLLGNEGSETEQARKDGIDVVEMWTRDRLITVAADRVVIRDEESPFWHGRIPFVMVELIPQINKLPGQSLMWAIKDHQEALWTLRNASFDSLHLQVDPPVNVDITDPGNAQRKIRPGQQFYGKGGIEPVKPVRITGAEHYTSQGAIDAIRTEMEQITGINSAIAGSSNANTATQAAIDQRQAKGRIGLMLMIADEAFAEAEEMAIQLNQQFLDFTKPVRIAGKAGDEWQSLNLVDSPSMFDVRPEASNAQAVRDLEIQQAQEALNAVLPLAQMVYSDGTTLNPKALAKRLGRALNVDEDELFVTAPPPPPEKPWERLVETISYKDVPPDVKRQMEMDAGWQPSQMDPMMTGEVAPPPAPTAPQGPPSV